MNYLHNAGEGADSHRSRRPARQPEDRNALVRMTVARLECSQDFDRLTTRVERSALNIGELQ